MTADQFNEKYKDHLLPGHYGLALDIPEVIDFLDEKFQEYIQKDSNFYYIQIKAKFNKTRVYSSLDDAETAILQRSLDVIMGSM